MKAVVLGKAMSPERVARTLEDREREKNRKATPEINGSSFVPPYASSPNPIPSRHPRARIRISRLITFVSAPPTSMSQQRSLVIVAKYKIER